MLNKETINGLKLLLMAMVMVAGMIAIAAALVQLGPWISGLLSR
jgi:hypothetical protein